MRTLESGREGRNEMLFPFTSGGKVVTELIMDTSSRGHNAGGRHASGGHRAGGGHAIGRSLSW